MTTTLELPWPPSLNGLFSDGRKRRTISKRYEEWRVSAGWLLTAQRPQKIAGPVHVRLLLDPPDRRERDLDNYAKATLDLLVKHEVIAADSRSTVKSLSMFWGDKDPERPGRVRVTLEAA